MATEITLKVQGSEPIKVNIENANGQLTFKTAKLDRVQANALHTAVHDAVYQTSTSAGPHTTGPSYMGATDDMTGEVEYTVKRNEAGLEAISKKFAEIAERSGKITR